MRVELRSASYLEVSLRIHTYSHTQQFPRILCVNPWRVNADGGFLSPQSDLELPFASVSFRSGRLRLVYKTSMLKRAPMAQ
jgi:hypothetical protein